MKKINLGLLTVIFQLFIVFHCHAAEPTTLSTGQTVYVPAYSHIYIGNKETPFYLTITLSVRNIDLNKSIKITEIKYYETQGIFLKEFITKPVMLGPLASTRMIIHQKDRTGGSGANFIVKWTSDEKCNAPVIEAVMISTQSQQGISFTSRGVPILPPPD